MPEFAKKFVRRYAVKIPAINYCN